MALPIVFAFNQTAVDLVLVDLGITVLAGQTLSLTDLFTFWEISSSTDLEMNIAAGGILINDGATTFDIQGSLNYLNITGNVNSSPTASSNQVAVFADTGGNRIDGSQVTISQTGNVSIPGQIELSSMSAPISAGANEGVIWVANTSPAELHFTDNTGNDINLSQQSGAISVDSIDSLVLNLSEDSHEEIIKINGKVSSVIIWKTQSKNVKIRESLISRVAGRVSSIIIKQYDASGSLVIGQTLTKVISRDLLGKVSAIDNTES